MKAFLLLIGISILFPIMSFAQIAGIYDFQESWNSDIQYEVTLFKNGVFEFTIRENLTDDMEQNSLLSYGRYVQKKGNIELYDKYNGFNMVFEHQGSRIVAKKVFKGFLNKIFYKSDYQIKTGPETQEYKLNSKFLDLIILNNTYKIKNEFTPGLYLQQDSSLIFNLKTDKTYVLKYRNFIISEGTWNRIKNELFLFDTTIKHTFSLYIGKSFLCDLFIPVNRISTRLYKEEDWMRDFGSNWKP